MPNPNRKMATMRVVASITKIEGADKVEAVQVDGWTIVDEVGKWHKGDYAVYFEPDTALPTGDVRYSYLARWGERQVMFHGAAIMAHVLRTRRIRGCFSQGLLMKPQDVLPSTIPEYAYSDMFERKTNLTSLCGVVEYEPVRGTDQGNIHILRRYDPWVAPRTDAVRIQNVDEDLFALMKKTQYFASVKVDGTSITMLNDPRYQKVRVFSHNNELSTEDGFGKQVLEQAEQQGIMAYLNEHPGITMQMEAAGPKINGNRLGLKAMRLYVFSMWDTEKCEYISPYGVLTVYCVRAGNGDLTQSLTPRMPLLFRLSDYPTTLDLIDYVDGLHGHITDRLDEGIVIHILSKGDCTDEEWHKLQVELGSQMQVKVISRKYLLKAKE